MTRQVKMTKFLFYAIFFIYGLMFLSQLIKLGLISYNDDYFEWFKSISKNDDASLSDQELWDAIFLVELNTIIITLVSSSWVIIYSWMTLKKRKYGILFPIISLASFILIFVNYIIVSHFLIVTIIIFTALSAHIYWIFFLYYNLNKWGTLKGEV